MSETAEAESLPVERREANRRIWSIAGPAIVANISGPMVGVVDTWAIGHLPNPLFLVAIGVGSFLFHFIYWAFGFLRMGTTGLIAQAHGRQDQSAKTRILARSAILGLAIGLAVLAANRPLLSLGLGFVDAGAEEARLVAAYWGIRIWATPAALLRITVVGFLFGTQKAQTALAIEVTLNILNAGLTALLVAGVGLGIEGAAWGSLLAETLAAAAALVVAVRILRAENLVTAMRDRRFWTAPAFIRLFRVNGYLFVRTLFLLSAFGILWRTGLSIGTLEAAANQVLLQFLMLTSFGLDGIAYAAEALAGAAYGTRSQVVFSRYVRMTTAWAVAISIFYVITFALFGSAIIDGFTDISEVRIAARDYLPWLIAMPFVAVWSYQFDGVFIGATATGAMMWTMIAAFALYVGLLQIAVPVWSNHGLWLSMAVFLAARGFGLAVICYPALRRRAGEPMGAAGD